MRIKSGWSQRLQLVGASTVVTTGVSRREPTIVGSNDAR
jgi:hypothetical protein